MRMIAIALASFACLFSVPVFAGAAPAGEPNLMGTFRDWHVYNTGAGAERSCFVVSPPQTKTPANVNRGPIFFMITSWPGRNVKNQPSVVPGYPFRDMSTATVEIGAEKFEFFTQNDGGTGGAWMESADGEEKLIAAMRKGSTMNISGTSQRGTNTKDSYSLAGIAAALDKLVADCK